MEIEFSQAEEHHINELIELINSAYRGEKSKVGWTTEADLLDGQRIDANLLKEHMEKEDSTILIAQEEGEEDGEILGCVHIEKQGNKMYLGMLTVKPELQNEGIGKKLMEETDAFADFWDCTKTQITVISVRNELIAWYEKKGFKKTGENKPFPYGDERFGVPKRQDLEFLVMEKSSGYHSF